MAERPGSATPPQAMVPLTEPNGAVAPTVTIWDPLESRAVAVGQVVKDCGALADRAAEPPSLPWDPAMLNGRIALVGLAAPPAKDQSALKILPRLKAAGCRVVVYGDGLHGWPLSVRCLPLLAGATHLLDSGEPRFPAALASLLRELLLAVQREAADDREARAAMEALGLVGRSRQMLAIFRTILRLAAVSDLPVLLTGETGTGKELLAHAIHARDPGRACGPFVALNCAALTPTLAESELFGHRRGAFTGAEQHRRGLIRAAEGGVLFLDEVGELDGPLQAKLLRVLQDGRVLGVGEDREVPVNVRVLAATNRDLNDLVRRGQFRADLLHRINVLSVHVPPLRERPADVPALVEHFLAKHRSLTSGRAIHPSPDLLEALARARLPGNVRQLENLLRQALVQKETASPLGLSDLPADLWLQLVETDETHPPEPAGATASTLPHTNRGPAMASATSDPWAEFLAANAGGLECCLESCERSLLGAALRQCGGNQSRTARLLGISARSVYNKLRKYGLHDRPL